MRREVKYGSLLTINIIREAERKSTKSRASNAVADLPGAVGPVWRSQLNFLFILLFYIIQRNPMSQFIYLVLLFPPVGKLNKERPAIGKCTQGVNRVLEERNRVVYHPYLTDQSTIDDLIICFQKSSDADL